MEACLDLGLSDDRMLAHIQNGRCDLAHNQADLYGRDGAYLSSAEAVAWLALRLR
jgi:hypothetical protein